LFDTKTGAPYVPLDHLGSEQAPIELVNSPLSEEPSNQGPWSFVRWRIEDLLGASVRLRYVGRRDAASPATGSYKIHQAEEAAIVEAAVKRWREERRTPAGDDGCRSSRNR
jgi:2-oxoglutarate dehydrogenase complex dehydrogenase (E1) component-like enzyme